MKKFLLLWTNTTTVRHYNYHFTHFGEIYDYLDKKFPDEFDALDADVLNYDINDIYKEILNKNYKVVVMYISTENIYSSCSFSNFNCSPPLIGILKSFKSSLERLAFINVSQ